MKNIVFSIMIIAIFSVMVMAQHENAAKSAPIDTTRLELGDEDNGQKDPAILNAIKNCEKELTALKDKNSVEAANLYKLMAEKHKEIHEDYLAVNCYSQAATIFKALGRAEEAAKQYDLIVNIFSKRGETEKAEFFKYEANQIRAAKAGY